MLAFPQCVWLIFAQIFILTSDSIHITDGMELVGYIGGAWIQRLLSGVFTTDLGHLRSGAGPNGGFRSHNNDGREGIRLTSGDFGNNRVAGVFYMTFNYLRSIASQNLGFL